MSYPVDHKIAFLPNGIIFYIDKANILHVINKDRLGQVSDVYDIIDMSKLDDLDDCKSVCSLIQTNTFYSILILKFDGSIVMCCFGGSAISPIIHDIVRIPIIKIETCGRDFYLLNELHVLQNLKINIPNMRAIQYSEIIVEDVMEYECSLESNKIIVKRVNSYDIYGGKYPVSLTFGVENLDYRNELYTVQKITTDISHYYIIKLNFITFENIKKVKVGDYGYGDFFYVNVITTNNVLYNLNFHYSNQREIPSFPGTKCIRIIPTTPISFYNRELHTYNPNITENFIYSSECGRIHWPVMNTSPIFIMDGVQLYISDNLIFIYILNNGFGDRWKSKIYTMHADEPTIVDVIFNNYEIRDNIYNLIFVDSMDNMHFYDFERNDIIREHPIENLQLDVVQLDDYETRREYTGFPGFK